MSRTIAALGLALALITAGSWAWAEQTSTPEGLFRRGGQLFQNEQYNEALEAYQRSYDLNPVNVVLYNIAMCQRALGRHGDAVDTFERYLSRGGDAIPAERREEVRGLIEEMRDRLGSTAAPTPSTPPTTPTETRPVEPQVTRTEPAPPPPPPPQTNTTTHATEPEPVQPEPRAERPGRGYLIGAYVSGGVAVALLATTVGLFAWNAGRDNDWEDTSAQLTQEWIATREDRTASDAELEQMYRDNEALGDQLHTWGAVEWALFGVGIAALGAAVALLVVGLRARRQATASLIPGIGGFSFNMSWVTL